MRSQTASAAVIAAVFGVIAFIVIVIGSVLAASAIMPAGAAWDPVSMWHSSARVRLLFVAAAAIPIVMSTLLGVMVFKRVRNASGDVRR